MDENDQKSSPGTKLIIEARIKKELLRNGLPTSLMADILSDIQVVWTATDFGLYMPDGKNRLTPLERYVAQLKTDPIPRISAQDERSLHSRFGEIAAGKVVVCDE